MKVRNALLNSLRIIWSIAKIGIVLFIIFVGYTYLTDYSPSEKQPLELRHSAIASKKIDSSFSLLTWNLGYGGLGAGMDFFYDGGEHVRPSIAEHRKYRKGIRDFLLAHDSIDIMLFQEVDRNSGRTYSYNQVFHLVDTLQNYYSIFAKNYDVPFVPLPVTDPLGRIDAGMLTLSRMRPMMSYRYALPQVYPWPKNLFMLDRAFIMSTFPLPGKSDLVVMNIHNSAYVEEKEAREQELERIQHVALGEFEKGNYVVIGGDWNQNPPGYEAGAFRGGQTLAFSLKENFIGEDWKFAFDADSPTNRSLKSPLSDDTEKTIIDFYLLSPNLKKIDVRVLEQNFAHSDHEPVYLKVKLNPR